MLHIKENMSYMDIIRKTIRKLVFPYNLNNDINKLIIIRRKILRGGVFSILLKRQYSKICTKNQSYIPLSAQLGDGVVFPHGICGVFISQGAVIGKNAVIFHQVTIGSNTLTDSIKFGAPTLGDNVYIGAGAKIIGKVHIGNNVRIGANAVITFDVPDNATVVLEHPRVIMHENSRDNSFHCY